MDGQSANTSFFKWRSLKAARFAQTAQASTLWKPTENALVITHGSFGGAERMRDAIAANSPEVSGWSEEAGFDLIAPGVFHSALLRCALRANPGGKVIFRASTPQRIIENTQALQEPLDARDLCRQARCAARWSGM